VSPRRNRPRSHDPRPGAREAASSRDRTDQWRGEEWSVRSITGGGAAKHYRCPGCDQEIPPGVPHVVAWPSLGAVDDRRHWHGPCWSARDRRGARQLRARNAPRY
jgi:hypothetical protein